MTPNRRDFLKTSAVGVLGASAFPSPFVHALSKSADAADTRTLVVIYLRGGCDSLNVVVPYHDENYYAIRPTIGIAAPGTTDLPEGERAALPLTRGFGLHPAMQSLMPLWEQKLFAPIINVGSTHPTRSHFDAQDFMEWAAPGIKSIQEGWLNRYLQRTSTPNDHFLRGFSPQPLLPRALRGDYAVLAAPGPGSEVAIDTFAELYDNAGRFQPHDRAGALGYWIAALTLQQVGSVECRCMDVDPDMAGGELLGGHVRPDQSFVVVDRDRFHHPSSE